MDKVGAPMKRETIIQDLEILVSQEGFSEKFAPPDVRSREEIERELSYLFTHGVRDSNAAMQTAHRIFEDIQRCVVAETKTPRRRQHSKKHDAQKKLFMSALSAALRDDPDVITAFPKSSPRQ